jgi:hypothetical protein
MVLGGVDVGEGPEVGIHTSQARLRPQVLGLEDAHAADAQERVRSGMALVDEGLGLVGE